jgi:glycosyltransferase involved in cell wall biosynthesis
MTRPTAVAGNPLVSVIVPFFNAGEFLEETIASVFAQAYEHWQLLLVDDGSSDASTDIARRYAQEYPGRVYYFDHYQHRNRGVCFSRNLGVKQATGEYVALLDADDVWLPHKLERQLAIFRAHPAAGLVFGVSQYWVSWTGKAEDLQNDTMPELGIKLNTLFRPPSLLFSLYPLGRGAAPCPSDLLLARELVERVGGFEEQFDAQRAYQLYEDQAFLVKVYLASPVFAAEESWTKYRMHSNSCMALFLQDDQRHAASRSFFCDWLEKYLAEHGIENEKIWSAVTALRRRQFGVKPRSRLLKLLTRARRLLARLDDNGRSK